jgi:hypothetical protein
MFSQHHRKFIHGKIILYKKGGGIMAIGLIPEYIRENYYIQEWRHATTILQNDFPNEWQDILDALENFRLLKSDLVVGGGRKSNISEKLDNFLYEREWEEKSFSTSVLIDEEEHVRPTHKIDCFKNRIALEIEWNNKTEFYDRDLNNFRLLFDLGAISVGVIVTRTTELQEIFNTIGRGSSFGSSTTHLNKLLPKIEGGGAGGCPILVFGIKDSLYIEDDNIDVVVVNPPYGQIDLFTEED